jgi:tetratricopeptide (TPR) repeat protein
LSILVFSNLFEPVAGMAGDRLAYISSLGYCILIGYLLITLYESQKSNTGKKLVFVFIAFVLICYSGISIARNNQWKNALTLMRHDIEHVSNSAQGHILLASNLMKSSFEHEYTKESNQMQREALEHFKKSAAIDPSYLNVWFDMGRTYQILGQPKLALSCFQQTHTLDSTFYQATFNVAIIAEELKDTATAITYYNRCIRFNPEMIEAYTKLSYLHFRMRQFGESIGVNQKAIAYNPNWPEPYDNIARVYSGLNQPEKAAPYLKKFQELQ